ncbi:MAG TPA: hypothetical protein C5S51_05275 [Methanosarcinaceae archaeon]|nr:hypothetical protein [Methanosarcinaceae archaeon]
MRYTSSIPQRIKRPHIHSLPRRIHADGKTRNNSKQHACNDVQKVGKRKEVGTLLYSVAV